MSAPSAAPVRQAQGLEAAAVCPFCGVAGGLHAADLADWPSEQARAAARESADGSRRASR